MSFDPSISSVAGAAQSLVSNPNAVFGQLGGLASVGQKLSGALNNLSDPAKFLSQIRSMNLPSAGDITGKITKATATFGGADANNDWRVRLSVPGGTIFDGSAIFAPFREAGGLVFPYTPSINIGGSAKYEQVTPVHNNYPFHAYSGSQPDAIELVAPFYVENSAEAQYWIATVHFLRAVTKMFTGDSSPAGNPPVICQLNGYGEYVFKNVPVVVTKFSVQLDATSDYIATPSPGSGMGALDKISAGAKQLAGVGRAIPAVGEALNAASNIIGGAGSIADFLGGGGGGSGGSASHVPTKSSFSISLLPIYSRESVRTFNLQKFVNGDYMTSSGAGYI